MAESQLAECPYCRATQLERRDGPQACGACDRVFEYYELHPPGQRTVRVEGAVGRTPCFQHEGNASVGSCGRCGSFLCALCETPAEGTIYCPACFSRLHGEGKLASTRRELVSWGRLVMVLGFLGWIPFYGIAFGVASVAAGFLGLSRMKRDQAPGGRAWVYSGMILGAIGMMVWIAFFGLAIWSMRAHVQTLRPR